MLGFNSKDIKMKKVLFFCVFIAVLFVDGRAQDFKPKVERWRKVLPDQKFPKIDTTVRVSADSVLRQFQSGPVDIPNVYNKNQSYNSRMPVVVLSGKGLAPMPGTEKLDKMKDAGVASK